MYAIDTSFFATEIIAQKFHNCRVEEVTDEAPEETVEEIAGGANMDLGVTPNNEKDEAIESFEFSVIDPSDKDIDNDNDKNTVNVRNDDCSWFNNVKDKEEKSVPIARITIPTVPSETGEGPAGNVKTAFCSPLNSKEESIRLRRSARLAAKTRQHSDKSKSLLGSVIVNGRRCSARLLKIAGLLDCI